MKVNRRDLLFAGGLSVLAGMSTSGRSAAPARAQSQTSGSQAERLLEALQKNRLPLTMSDGPAGRGWDWLVQEARDAQVVDFRALRPLSMRGLEAWNPDLVRTIHGYDAAVIWKGARASSGLM